MGKGRNFTSYERSLDSPPKYIKRLTKTETEYKRRLKFNHKLKELGDLLPPKDSRTKYDIIEEAEVLLRKMMKENELLLKQLKEEKAMNNMLLQSNVEIRGQFGNTMGLDNEISNLFPNQTL